MRKSALPLKLIHKFVKCFFAKINYQHQTNKTGRPKKIPDELIITLWLFQTLTKFSFRETLQYASKEGFTVPSLRGYYYRVKNLNENILEQLVEKSSKPFLSTEDNQIQQYISDGTGFGFGQKYQLKWMRGTQIRTVSSHVRLCVVIAVNNRGNAVIVGCGTGKAYASEIKMLRSILSKMERLERVPFIADKGYDAVDVIGKVKELGGIPAVGVKQTQRRGVKDELRKESMQEWERWKKKGIELRHCLELSS